MLVSSSHTLSIHALLSPRPHTPAGGRGCRGGFSAPQSRKMTTESSIGKSFSFPTRLLSPSGSAVQKSTPLGSPSTRSLGQALVKNLGHDVLARSARTPVLSAMSALHAHRQRGHEDVFGFCSRAETETHHPAKHSALESLAATRWRTAFTNGLRASCTGESPVQRA